MAATKFEHPLEPKADIYYLGDYIPWSWHQGMGGDGSNWPQHSIDVLELKKSKIPSLNKFTKSLCEIVDKDRFDAVTAVPSHDPNLGFDQGVRLLAKQVAAQLGIMDGRSFLKRNVKIAKLADGGSRAAQIHLDSVSADPVQCSGKRILLLDDVITSGNSVVACRKILLEAGAAEVICVALGCTKH